MHERRLVAGRMEQTLARDAVVSVAAMVIRRRTGVFTGAWTGVFIGA